MNRGRPTAFRSEYIDMAYVACAEMGAMDTQLAKLFQVSIRTIYQWRRAHPEFSQSLKRGKDKYDSEVVEKALLKRANGFQYSEVTQEPAKAGEMRVTKRIKKYMPPDVTAQIFWLKNRRPGRWKDRQDVNLGVKDDLMSILAAGRKRVKME